MYDKWKAKHLRKMEKKGVFMKSKKWKVNKADVERVVKNALMFLAPVAIVEITLLQKGSSLEELLIAFQVWGLGVALDFFRKLSDGK